MRCTPRLPHARLPYRTSGADVTTISRCRDGLQETHDVFRECLVHPRPVHDWPNPSSKPALSRLPMLAGMYRPCIIPYPPHCITRIFPAVPHPTHPHTHALATQSLIVYWLFCGAGSSSPPLELPPRTAPDFTPSRTPLSYHSFGPWRGLYVRCRAFLLCMCFRLSCFAPFHDQQPNHCSLFITLRRSHPIALILRASTDTLGTIEFPFVSSDFFAIR
ncbi:hypothetical protein C8Q73DRAFT_44934 [Cubamyces lactineus]|nr:hypothetical protein C8Q73DRAFT_44934 [Cubamyces lactineus]